jgi:hypothetical protein
MTVAEKFEKFLAEGPEWVEIKKNRKISSLFFLPRE